MIKLMIVDDETPVRETIRTLLPWTKLGIQIVGSCGSGPDALARMVNDRPDILMTDIKMPVMDGIAATQEIREIERKEKRKRLPIIAVTARAMFGDKERILENQLDDYIAKPYNLNDVVDTLNKYIDE